MYSLVMRTTLFLLIQTYDTRKTDDSCFWQCPIKVKRFTNGADKIGNLRVERCGESEWPEK